MSLTADAPFRAQDLLHHLEARSITPPPAVMEAVKNWQRVTNTQPQVPAAHQLRDRIIDGTLDSADLAGALLNHIGASQLADAWRSAGVVCARRVLDAAVAHRDNIHAQLRALAEPLIAKLETVAALGATTLDTLVREARHEEAKQYADRETVAAELRALYGIRDQYLLPPNTRQLTVGGYDYSRWATPDLAEHHGQGDTLADATLAAIRAGAKLWFPSTDEAIARAQAAWDEHAAEEAERRKQQFGIGSTVFLG